ncbi:MAG: TolC family protein [Candidatus Cloacimonetes bacterium]|nr:TolC family protein [Candidatus Cloacimonadota bacterium]
MKRIFILIVVILFGMTVLDSVSLNLEQSIELARDNNKELQIAREEVERYRQEYRNVRGNLFPQLTLSGGYQYSKTTLPDSAVPPAVYLSDEINSEASANDTIIAGFFDQSMAMLIPEQEQEQYSAFAQIKLDQVVFLGGKLINGISIAGKLYHLQEKKYYLTEQDVIFNTVDQYYQTKLAEEVVKIQREALDFAERYYDQVINMYDQGLVSEYDKLRARLEVLKLQPQLLEAEKNRELARESFGNYLNLKQEELELTDPIELPEMEMIDLTTALDEGLQQRMELELSDLSLQVSKVNLRYEKGNFLPDIAISAEYNYYGSDQSKIESSDWGDSYQIGIGFSMPLFTGFSNSAKIAKARHSLKQAELNHQDLKEKIELDIRNAYHQWQANLSKVSTQQENVELAEKGLAIAQARYENQISNQLEVIDAQLQLKTARLSYLQTAYSAALSYIKLKKAIGREL